MSSGNFLIGNGLSLDNFAEYLMPKLRGKGVNVGDRVSVSTRVNKSVLASLSGDFESPTDLETKLNEALIELGNSVKEAQNAHEYRGPWQHQLYGGIERKQGIYEVLGAYSEDDTASKLFLPLATKYLIAENSVAADRLKEKVRQITGKTLKDI